MVDGGLRGIFRKGIPEFFWQSIESGLTGMGIPDTHYIAPSGISGWIEHKRARSNAVVVRQGQVAWIERYRRNGGRVFVAVRVQGRQADNDLVLIDGSEVRALYSGGIAATAPLLRSPLRTLDWDLVRRILAA